MSRYKWDDFQDRYLNNREEFFFEYKNYSFWLTTDINDNPCVNLTSGDFPSGQSIDKLFEVLNIYQQYKDCKEILLIDNNDVTTKHTYEEMKSMLLNTCACFYLDSFTQIYSYYKDENKYIIISKSYKDYNELLREFTLDGKTINENWNELF